MKWSPRTLLNNWWDILASVDKNGDLRWLLVSVAGTCIAVLMAISKPMIAVTILAVASLVVVAWKRPGWMFHLTLITAFLTVPEFVPRTVGPLFLFEPFLLVCAVLSLWKSKSAGPKSLGIFLVACLAAVLTGVSNDNPSHALIADVRPLAQVVFGVVAAGGALLFTSVHALLTTAKWILWVSLALTLAASLGIVGLVGRSEVASLVGAAAGADRLITPATFFALAIACGSMATLVTRHSGLKAIIPLALPAITILFMSFSRNNIVAMAVALIFALLAFGSYKHKAAGLGKAIGISAVVAAALWVTVSTFEVPWLQEQIEGFNSRVLGGLTPTGLATDGSALFRVTENEQIWPVIHQAPILGHGFGAAYKAPYGPSDYFLATTAPYYAHNYYYWLALKGGLVAVLAFAILTVTPMIRAVVRGSAPLLIVASTLAAFMVISTVAPMPNGFPTGILFGLTLGLTHYFSRIKDDTADVDGRQADHDARGVSEPYNRFTAKLPLDVR